MKFLPATRPGKLSAWLTVCALLAMLLLYLLAEVLRLLQSDWTVPVLTVAALAAFILAAVLGLIAVVRHRERSVLVYLSTLFGLFVLVFFLVSLYRDLTG